MPNPLSLSIEKHPFVREALRLVIGSEEEEWRGLPPMKTARTGHTCGLMTSDGDGDGREIIVVGGWNADGDQDSVEIFNVQGREWREGERFVSMDLICT